jgi:hypothetical protein
MLPFGIALTNSLTFGDLIVGAGTLALACFTAWLGFETRASAKAAQAAVEASEEPFVIASPTPDWALMRLLPHELPAQGQGPPLEIHRAGGDTEDSFLRLRLWNIGSGPAIVQQVRLSRDREFLAGLPRFQPVGAGQVADIEIPSPAWPPSSRAATLTVGYTRASGIEYRTSQEVVIEGTLVLARTCRRIRVGLPD